MSAQDQQTHRKKLYINREVQGALILRSVLHWYFYMCAILLTVVIFTVIRDPSVLAIKLVFKSFVYFSPAIVASVVLLPLFIWDILKASNKIAGPIYRLKNEMSLLASGGEVRELRFRDGDHWKELADEFNLLAKTLSAERESRNAIEKKQEQLSETSTV